MKKVDGTVLETTRLDEDGSGIPKAFVLGKGLRAPRGWELALQGAAPSLALCRLHLLRLDFNNMELSCFHAEMTKGERAAFQISPEYSYAQKGCQVKPPAGVPADASVVIDMQAPYC